MVIGSSCLPSIFISCTTALPMEVTRRESCACLPLAVGSTGMVVRKPSQEPDRVLIVSNDFCASDCANSNGVESNVKTAINAKQVSLICISLKPPIISGCYYSVIHNYNTIAKG